MMTNVDQLAILTALNESRISRNAGALDYVLQQHPPEHFGLKRIQFETWPWMVDSLEEVCTLFAVSKREFLEAAVLDAINRAHQKFNSVYTEVTGEEFAKVSPKGGLTTSSEGEA